MITSSFVPRFVIARTSVGLVAAALLAIGTTCLTPTTASADPKPAKAPTWRVANGNYGVTLSDEWTQLGTIGGVEIWQELLSFEYAGDLVGVASDVNYVFINPDGSFESFATEVGTNCTLGGRTGGFTAQYTIQGSDLTHYVGQLVFTRGTGGLAGLRGGGTFSYQDPISSYSYQYAFIR